MMNAEYGMRNGKASETIRQLRTENDRKTEENVNEKNSKRLS
jgi:hypothetical protein